MRNMAYCTWLNYLRCWVYNHSDLLHLKIHCCTVSKASLRSASEHNLLDKDLCWSACQYRKDTKCPIHSHTCEACLCLCSLRSGPVECNPLLPEEFRALSRDLLSVAEKPHCCLWQSDSINMGGKNADVVHPKPLMVAKLLQDGSCCGICPYKGWQLLFLCLSCSAFIKTFRFNGTIPEK